MKLYVDDVRKVPDDTWNVVRTFEMAVYIIKTYGKYITHISLDHDLGETIDGKDGAGLGKMLVDLAIDDKLNHNVVVTCHSQNPIGKKNIEGYISDIQRVLVNA